MGNDSSAQEKLDAVLAGDTSGLTPEAAASAAQLLGGIRMLLGGAQAATSAPSPPAEQQAQAATSAPSPPAEQQATAATSAPSPPAEQQATAATSALGPPVTAPEQLAVVANMFASATGAGEDVDHAKGFLFWLTWMLIPIAYPFHYLFTFVWTSPHIPEWWWPFLHLISGIILVVGFCLYQWLPNGVRASTRTNILMAAVVASALWPSMLLTKGG